MRLGKSNSKLILNSILHTITFEAEGFRYEFYAGSKMTDIYSISEYDNGYFVIQTNLGEEYIDLLGAMELCGYKKSEIQRSERILSKIQKSDIEIEKKQMKFVTGLKGKYFDR